MISFVSDPPFVPDDSEIEFIRLKVQGQSFMLHQIRRMVGLVIAIMRGKVNFDFFEKAFSKEKYLIPQAPGLGLVLNNVHFTRYDNRYGNDGHHHPLTFEAQEEEVEKFFRSKILPTIITTELKDLSMQRWLGRRLANHNFEVNAKEDPSSEKEDDGEDDDE
jgi:tRNA pseudouridine38-40 synthase